jgi:hypothetical protein
MPHSRARAGWQCVSCLFLQHEDNIQGIDFGPDTLAVQPWHHHGDETREIVVKSHILQMKARSKDYSRPFRVRSQSSIARNETLQFGDLELGRR